MIYINSIFFTDLTTGYAVGCSFSQDKGTCGIILRTVDGGSQWSAMNLSLPDRTCLNSVFFPDSNVGYVVGYKEHGLAMPTGIILKTVNGGDSWQDITPTDNNATYLNSVYFIDTQTGFSVGELINPNPDENNEGIILKTTNSGTNWTKLALPEIKPDDLESICFTNATTGYAAGYFFESGQGLFRGVILKTINGGETWYSLTLPGGDVNGQKLNSIFFLDNNNGYAVGDFGTILKTTTGGE